MNDQNSIHPTNPLLTVEEVADILRISRSTIWRWCQEGMFPTAFKIGRNWRIPRVDLEAIMGQTLPEETPAEGEGK